MFDLITIGDSTVDTIITIDEAEVKCGLDKEECLLCFNYAEKIPIKNNVYSVGGNAANVAVGCKKLGIKTAIVTELGKDMNGFAIKHELEQARVDTKYVKVLKGKETRYAIVLNYQGERTILSYHTDRKYSLPKLPKTKWIYYTSLGKSFEGLQDQILKYLFAHPETKLAFNPGSYQMKNGLAKIKRILPHVNLLFVNRQEAEKLVGKKKTTKALINALLKKGVSQVVMTDGVKGSFATEGKDIYFMKSFPLKPKAKTGAGDAYSSGFLSAILSGKTAPQAMGWGTSNSSGVIMKVGAQKGLLNKKQVSSIIKKYPRIKPQII
ncbi:MAG: carbohydrate kinase family protein [Candidatus Magasanikbacteria bacterium]|jgi:sugar/nucleoside kinase (ribokinase family)|nr:carbohydrate kinase family protein [Candidatus Magasanikbacteria bacterium]MBT4315035.1 carbohydrate kinase family protein [Candidatus Magasanikbacteria bacterium]MBT4546814.1 carbohydrate kinase family protein [Candidatus Magasanikbacteria bacterium]MBT6818979.1 carbohydrate kinase family protein [Candidatus Magasanikbacteria bacterium]